MRTAFYTVGSVKLPHMMFILDSRSRRGTIVAEQTHIRARNAHNTRVWRCIVNSEMIYMRSDCERIAQRACVRFVL